ncbi:hypothetical protein [Microvirga guangxiensis]|uniref:HARP domain-containing protein n=1 Tax=Microvirga guangxiensis TaxID=549386 RepID=A0A1G5KXD2_9HYPH|nr:hypothetical protein [Microvirga guangxiensis]SCZ05343.1 hypothetical protein SAMN02927923_03711 [Microvirga guangxiensis]
MELVSAFQVKPSDGEKPGAFASFPYDRDLVRRFREAFPRARWRGEDQGWFVPGTTAVQRLNTWMAQELETLDRHADAKGRDAYLFEPLESPYLTIEDDLQIRTPYSRTIVEALRSIPWAHWNPDRKIWHVPFRSYERLRLLWPIIEEAARRNEPAERKRRREEQRRLGPEPPNPAQVERRRRRYPVPGDDLPPLDTPLATFAWGVVTFEDVESHVIEEALDHSLYPHVKNDPKRYVWARWRMPALQEVYRTKPAREPEDSALRESRGWWWPSREELQERARKLREIERAQRARDIAHKSSAGL